MRGDLHAQYVTRVYRKLMTGEKVMKTLPYMYLSVNKYYR